MTYAHGSARPLILYPALSAALINAGFETALGAEWTIVGACSRVTGEAAEGTYALRINPAGAAAYAAQQPPRTRYLDAPDPYYVNFMAKAKAGSGQFDCRVRLMDPVGVDVVAPAFLALTVGSAAGIPIDDTYRAYRLGPIDPGAFDPTSSTAVLEVTLGALLTTPTFDVYLDAVHLGHALDFMDLGPANDGAQWSAQMPETTETATAIERIPNGYAAVVTWAGRKRGQIDILPMDDAALAKYLQFFNYTKANGQTVTVFQRRGDFREQYLERAVLMNDARGVRRLNHLWQATVDLQTEPLP